MEVGTPFTIIALSGQTGSGKTSLARELANLLGAPVISFGSFVRSQARNRGSAEDRVSLQNLGQALIDELGPDEFVRRVIHIRAESSGKILILEGVRSVEIWQAVQKQAFKSVLIYLDIDENKRIERLFERDNLDVTAIRGVMQHSMEANTPELRSHASLLLYSSSVEVMVSEVITELIDKGIIN